MEPVVFRKPKPRQYPDCYVLKGAGDGKSKFIRGLILDAIEMEEHNWKLARKYNLISRQESRCEIHEAKDAEMMIVAYGTAARVAKGAIRRLRGMNLKVGLFRPISLWPFPTRELRELSEHIKHFFGRPGGVVPTPAELSNVVSRRYPQKDAYVDRFLRFKVVEGPFGP